MMAQVMSFLPATQKAQIDFLASGFSPAQPWPLGTFTSEPEDEILVSLCLTNEIKQNNNFVENGIRLQVCFGAKDFQDP